VDEAVVAALPAHLLNVPTLFETVGSGEDVVVKLDVFRLLCPHHLLQP
jgi:hypothetical protein